MSAPGPPTCRKITAPLAESGQLQIINGPTAVTGEVRTAVTRGHTRAHQVVILESNGETALYLADMATLHYHLERLAWVTGYDVEPLESIETKRYWQKWAVENDALSSLSTTSRYQRANSDRTAGALRSSRFQCNQLNCLNLTFSGESVCRLPGWRPAFSDRRKRNQRSKRYHCRRG